jgi:hypothetical protein
MVTTQHIASMSLTTTTNTPRCVFRQENFLPFICVGYNNEFQVKGCNQYLGFVPGEIQTDSQYKCNDFLQPVRNWLEKSLNIYLLVLENPLANSDPITPCRVFILFVFFSTFRRILE